MWQNLIVCNPQRWAEMHKGQCGLPDPWSRWDSFVPIFFSFDSIKKNSKGGCFSAVGPGSPITATFPDEDFWTLQTLDTFDQSDDCRWLTPWLTPWPTPWPALWLTHWPTQSLILRSMNKLMTGPKTDTLIKIKTMNMTKRYTCNV